MFKVKNLRKKYGNVEVLKGINFEVPKGSIYGFLGRNGAGKTTTMNIIAGLLNYDSGEIYIDGRKLGRRERTGLIGYLPQIPEFYGYMTAYEYLKFIGELSNMNKSEIPERIDEVLDMVGLSKDKEKRIGNYSVGMKQRMGMGAALFNKPKILMLDEPTSALDPEGRNEVLNLIRELKNEGTTVFLSTHILNDVEKTCDSLTIINEGKVVLSGKLDDIEEKYIQPVYDIEFKNVKKDEIKKIESEDFIDKVVFDGNKVSVYVNDISKAENILLKKICGIDSRVTSYNIRKSNLEDIFIRLVVKNENV